MTVLRRLDCVLKPTKEKVLDYLPRIKDKSDSAKDLILNNIAGHNFHNRSKFDFEKLKAEPDKIAANLRNYINGFSASAREIIEYFNFDDQIERMDDPKSDMLIKEQNPSNIKFGNTFTVDGLEDEQFDYMLSNPPFGVDWKKAQKIIKSESENKGYSGRFGAGLPRINDGSLLFLQHMISKMKSSGTRIGIVFNGSPLFTGQAGSGESNIRKWIIENDMLEAIIAMPDQLFYNTGIATYVWILNNKKSEERKGKIQLINATGTKDDELIEEGKREFNRFFEKMTKSLGNKRKKIAENGEEKGIGFITKLYGDFEENEFVKIYPNDFFAYHRITVEEPLRDEKGKIIRNSKKEPKPDTSLRDYENIPFLREVETHGRVSLLPHTIEEYFEREVKPSLPFAWIDHSKTKVGYELNFTKYFYEFKPLRSLSNIKDEILKLEETTVELEKKVLE